MVNVISGICKFTYWRALASVTILWSDNDVETWISIDVILEKSRLGYSENIWYAFLSTVKQYFLSVPIASPVIVSLSPWSTFAGWQGISFARQKTFFKDGLLFRIWCGYWIMVLGIFSCSAFLTKVTLIKQRMQWKWLTVGWFELTSQNFKYHI